MNKNDDNFCSRLDILKRQFLCTFPVKSLIWQEAFNKWEVQEELINSTIYYIRNLDFPIRLSYQKAFLKFVINNVELSGEQVNDIVYNSLGNIVGQLDDDNKLCYRHYLTFASDISLCENVQIISDGTTGLTTWPAALVLGEWCLANKELLHNKTIVELGAGLGLVGLATLLNCRPSHMILTDCHHKVLSKLCDNVTLNLRLFTTKNASEINSNTSFFENVFSKTSLDNYFLQERIHFDSETSSVISVVKHFWGEEDNKLAQSLQPDILLAADVVYDSSLFPLLITCIKAFLQPNANNSKKKLILVCTERNTDTLTEFLQLLGEDCMITEGKIPEQKYFIWSTETPIRLFTVIAK